MIYQVDEETGLVCTEDWEEWILQEWVNLKNEHHPMRDHLWFIFQAELICQLEESFSDL